MEYEERKKLIAEMEVCRLQAASINRGAWKSGKNIDQAGLI